MRELWVNGRGEELSGEIGRRAAMLESVDIKLKRRPREAHKGRFGRVVILGGSVGYSGAPVLAARGAERTGAGLVQLLVPEPLWQVAAVKLDGAMPAPLPAREGGLSREGLEKALEALEGGRVCVIGPGLGRREETALVVRELVARLSRPLVLDADGINALEGHIDVLDSRKGRLTVLTPHEGEFARLGGDLAGGDRVGQAAAFADAHGCCLVLKGYRTVIALPDGRVWINPTGNPGMAKGGSGDVLAGMLGALLSQGMEAEEALPLGVYLHGLAGDRCALRLGEYAMTPNDLAEALPEVLREAEE